MSDLGNLSQCMVDSDQDAIARGRRLRRKALVISVCLEAICLATMLIWPLITPGILPPFYVVTPLPPYHGGSAPAARPQIPPHSAISTSIIRDHRPIYLARPSSPARQVAQEDAPEVGPDTGVSFGTGPEAAGLGPFVPGGSDNGLRIERPRETPASRPPVRQKMSEGVMAGALIHRVDPVYPTIARAAHISGVVRLRAIIATDGSIQHLEILTGQPILARAAWEAVSQWRYRPTLLSGAPVEVETLITVNFVLGQ
jgi:periplasmic protein TonB